MHKRFAILITAVGLLGTGLSAQEIQVNSRLVRHYVKPSLPEIAKKMGLKGTVRLEVEIAKDGKVTNVRALGGHPLLVEAASEAVRAWQFEPAKDDSKGEVAVAFQ
jgi:TonB family protein